MKTQKEFLEKIQATISQPLKVLNKEFTFAYPKGEDEKYIVPLEKSALLKVGRNVVQVYKIPQFLVFDIESGLTHESLDRAAIAKEWEENIYPATMKFIGFLFKENIPLFSSDTGRGCRIVALTDCATMEEAEVVFEGLVRKSGQIIKEDAENFYLTENVRIERRLNNKPNIRIRTIGCFHPKLKVYESRLEAKVPPPEKRFVNKPEDVDYPQTLELWRVPAELKQPKLKDYPQDDSAQQPAEKKAKKDKTPPLEIAAKPDASFKERMSLVQQLRAQGKSKTQIKDFIHENNKWTNYSQTKSGEEVDYIFKKYSVKLAVRPEKPQIKKTAKIPLKNVIDVVEKNFPDIVSQTKILLSASATLLLKDLPNPLFLICEGAPSSEKTTAISFFYFIEGLSFKSDSFSPKSFVSHFASVSPAQLENIDLLPKIRDKIFLIPEMATVFGKRKEDLLENIGILTRILDGEGLETDSGSCGHRSYTGTFLFCIIGASTPLSKSVWNIIGKLGNRFLFCEFPSKKHTKKDLITTLFKEKNFKQKIEECRAVVHEFLNGLFSNTDCYSIVWNKEKDEYSVLEKIHDLSEIVRFLRSALSVWREGDDEGSEYSYSSPLTEEPYRLNSYLFDICRGHAIINGRDNITKEELPILFKVALDSMPTERRKLFRYLLERNGQLYTEDIEQKLKCSKKVALKVMKVFEILGVVELNSQKTDEPGRPETKITLKEEFKWLLEENNKVFWLGGQMNLKTENNETEKEKPKQETKNLICGICKNPAEELHLLKQGNETFPACNTCIQNNREKKPMNFFRGIKG